MTDEENKTKEKRTAEVIEESLKQFSDIGVTSPLLPEERDQLLLEDKNRLSKASPLSPKEEAAFLETFEKS